MIPAKIIVIVGLIVVITAGLMSIMPAERVFGYADDEVEIIVSVDKSSYKVGDLLTIKGTGAHSYTIFVDIISPSGEQIADLMFIAASNGDFSTVWIIPHGLDDGTYTIDLRDVKKQTQTTFNIGNVSELQKLPHQDIKVETIAENLSIPWSIDFAYDGRIFFSERTGTLQVIDKGIQKQILDINVGGGEGGMLGIALDPDFESNHYIYIYYTYNELFSTKNKLVRYVESNNSLSEDKILLDDIPGAVYHDGGRIKFGPDDKLYITTGDSGDPNLSQRLDSVAGKILRINSDGTIPEDNPFPDSPVYSYGHRNPQGIDWDKSGVMIGTEHGQSAHDEINLIQGGQNYGWPDVIGDERKDGMTSPLLHSGDDTWAPSGGSFYYGEISQWDGLFFAASLRGQTLLAIDFDSEYNVISFEKLFLGEFGRLRDVANGPDGLYVLTSNQDGRGSPSDNDDRILRITPLYDSTPKWIENIFVWFEEGEISEGEKRTAIQWLMDKGILKDGMY